MPHNASEVSVGRRDCHLNCLARADGCHLVAQMIGCHNAAMECFRRAMISEQTFAGRQQNLNFANKLSRTFALHMEALDKHRGKGQQKVRVEHVTVNAGGQAIVGSVQGGGGVSQKSEDQAHAELSHAPEQEVRSGLEAEREAVPQASIPSRHSRAPGGGASLPRVGRWLLRMAQSRCGRRAALRLRGAELGVPEGLCSKMLCRFGELRRCRRGTNIPRL